MRTALSCKVPTTLAPTGADSQQRGLPGLDSGMTRGKWRREGLRGLWRKKHPREATQWAGVCRGLSWSREPRLPAFLPRPPDPPEAPRDHEN